MSTIICDIETEKLEHPEIVWVACCKEVESGKTYVFRPFLDGFTDLRNLLQSASLVVGHNWLGFDGPVLARLGDIRTPSCVDTLVVSRLLNYNNPGGHSLESWGERLGFAKAVHTDFSQYSDDMETYCARDVELTHRVYEEFRHYLEDPGWQRALQLEHDTATLCNTIGNNGFYFKLEEAKELYQSYIFSLSKLDKTLAKEFPPRYVPVKEIIPRGTKYGTLHRGQFKWLGNGDTDLSAFSIGAPFTTISEKAFNPGSPKEIVLRLNQAGWKPTDKTKGHILAEQEGDEEKLRKFRELGWRISEENLATLPESAPEACKSLVQRLTLASRISDLEEWMACYEPSTGRIHGNFNHIGSWTHRMSHNRPNMANIPGVIEIDEASLELDRFKAPMNSALRALWGVPEDRFLVGCDADSIQLRVFAHYIDDEEFTYALCQGSKKDGTDPHSVNQRALGDICKTRQHAKTFIYSFLMGAGVPKLAQVLECSTSNAAKAKENFMERYPRYAYLRNIQTAIDAERGYFVGVDGRKVMVTDKHKVISGYLQNAESVTMKLANQLWTQWLRQEEIPFLQVNFVHDEWQTEVPRDRNLAVYVGETQARAIKEAGEILELKCPMKGSYRVGRNWYETH